MKRIEALWIVLWSFCSFMTACGGGGGDAPVLSSQNAISAYMLAGFPQQLMKRPRRFQWLCPR